MIPKFETQAIRTQTEQTQFQEHSSIAQRGANTKRKACGTHLNGD